MRDEVGIIYKNAVASGQARSDWLERYIEVGSEDLGPDEDEVRNEPDAFAKLFSSTKATTIPNLYISALRELMNRTFVDAGDIFNALAFIGGVCSKAENSYRFNVPKYIKDFEKDFDRLDIETERVRLFHSVRELILIAESNV